jgi:transposase
MLENRPRYDRSQLRYPSDLTDDKWALIKPLIPAAKRGGNKRTVDAREMVNGATRSRSFKTACRGSAARRTASSSSAPMSASSLCFLRRHSSGCIEGTFAASAQTLDRRTRHRLAQPLLTFGKGLGANEPQRAAFLRWASVRVMLRKLCQTRN